jgi:16S rRNA (cytidine1402-2'-O)-methyltransferase
LRELTKIYEESLHGTAQELFEHFTKTPPRGEIILLMEADLTPLDFSALTPEEHVAHLQENYGLTLEQAIKNVARLREVPKREIYRTIHQLG